MEDADLLCIDEAAAIPLPLVKKLMGAGLILMASTINGWGKVHVCLLQYPSEPLLCIALVQSCLNHE